MRKLNFLFRTVLLLCALVGSMSAWAQTYKKITAAPTDWSGDYLIVYENSSTSGYVWSGVDANSNYVSATISSGSISKPNNAVSVTIASMTGGYSIKVNGGNNNGKYISGTSGSNTTNFGTSAVANTLTYSSGVDIASNTSHFVFNSTSGTTRYRYYKSATYSGSSYKKPQLYKLAYTVSYDSNGGTGTMTDSDSPYLQGTTVTVKDNSFTKDGYEFTGWNTKANGSGTSYAAGATFNIGENTTLYAQWVAAGEYISSTPTSADIATAGDVAEFNLSTNLASPSFSIKYYTTAEGDVEASKPAWLGEVEFAGNTLDIVVNENTGAARTAYFKVYSGETYSDVFTINQAAYVAVTGVSLDITSKTLLVNGTVTLTATVNPDNASYKTISWKSSDETVATVDNGVVTAIAAGTATITVTTTDGTKTATCAITVTDGSINLDATGEIEITSFPSFSGSGYQSKDPYTIGDYDWKATNCMLSSNNLQLKASTGVLTSPTIKCAKGFTVTVTVPANSVTVSDGTNSASTSNGSATLTTTKTSTTITITAGSSYAQVSNITITPSKDPVATEVAITDPGTLAKDATGTFAYTATTEEANTASWTSGTTGVITITNAATGAYTAVGRGTSKITLTLTPTDATTYRAVTAERTITVTAPVEVSASDVEMTYGDAAKAIGATTSAGYAGTLTYASGNTNIATVDASGKVTAVAAGTTTITISAPADAEHLYTAGDDKVINVTVNAPAGGTTAADYTQTADEYETLTSAVTGWTYTNWTTNSTYGACSTAGTAGQLKTKDYEIPAKANPCVFFEHAGKTFDDPSAACKLYVQEGDNTPVELTIPTYFTGSDWTYVESGDIDISAYIGKTVHFIFDYNPSTDNEGKWEVKNFGIYYDSFGVKLNASGYATFCSQYPLDFSKANAEDKGFTAWQITNVTTTEITFTQIIDKIKGGQGILLKGAPNSIVTLTSADGSTVLSDNKLVGTLAPTNLVAGEYFALSGDKFVPVNAGNAPAGKALLPASAIPTTARELKFVFEGETTGIAEMKNKIADGKYYNLNGQRVENLKKGGLYIMNGKKVVIK